MIPVASTYSFCNFVLLQITKRLTPARLTLVQSVKAAALAQTYISDSDWNNFLLATSDYYRTWQINKDFNPEYVYDADTLLYLAQLPTQPTPFRVELLNSLIVQLKADGNWTELDRLWIHATEYKDNAVVSLVNPSSTKITEVNNPAWVANEGYTGNGTTSYLNSNYNTSTSSIKYVLNSAMFGKYIRTSSIGSAIPSMGNTDGSGTINTLNSRNSADNATGRLNSTSVNSPLFANTNTKGFYAMVRTSSTAESIWLNGISKNTNAEASTYLINNNVYLLGYNASGTPALTVPRQIAISIIGSGAVNQLKLYNAIQTYMTAIGKQV